MDGINCFHIGVLIHDSSYCPEHMPHGLTKVFTAMRCNQNQPAAQCPCQFGMGIVFTHCGFQRVNCRIAGHINAVRILTLAQKILL